MVVNFLTHIQDSEANRLKPLCHLRALHRSRTSSGSSVNFPLCSKVSTSQRQSPTSSTNKRFDSLLKVRSESTDRQTKVHYI